MKNAYVDGQQKVIPSVLLYAFFEGKLLMIHARDKDGLLGKWNGLGGKLELGESMREACIREFFEEASCATSPDQWQWTGQLYFPNFKAHKNEDWWVNVFLTHLTPRQVEQISLHDETAREGPLSFVAASDVAKLDIWEGDRYFLPYIFEKKLFEGTFYYENGRCIRHEISPLIDLGAQAFEPKI